MGLIHDEEIFYGQRSVRPQPSRNRRRPRPAPPAAHQRRRAEPPGEFTAAAEPFKGISADGNLITGLYPIRKTGVTTDSIREAAADFLGALTPEQRAKTLFPIDTIEWRKWSNIHPTLMRHGTALFEMSDRQRDCAFSLLRESLSQQGFEGRSTSCTLTKPCWR
jgi:hypothetical protein